MKNKLSHIVIITLLFSIFSFNTQFGSASLNNIAEGDTIYYKVSEFIVPYDEFFSVDDGIDPNEIVLDLSDSQLGFKVMKKFSNGSLILNSFVILGKDVNLPFPETSSNLINSLFGENIKIPAGIGLSIGSNIPGNNLVTFLESSQLNNNIGLPFYIDPETTENFKTYIDDLISDLNLDATINDGFEIFEMTTILSDNRSNITLKAEWFKSGDNQGLFKGLKVKGTIKNYEDKYVDISISFTFEKKEFRPLPIEIINKEMQTFLLEKSDFNLKLDGVFADNINKSVLEDIKLIKDNLTEFKGKDIVRINITEVDGLFYKTNVGIIDFESKSWENDINSTEFNGFTGSSTINYSSNSSLFNFFNFNSLSFIPTFAPGITSDWTIWDSKIKTIRFLLNELTSTMNSASGKNLLYLVGITTNQLNSIIDFRQSDEFMYIFGEINVAISYDASNPLLLFRPSGFNGSESAELTINGNGWTSYTDKGLFAGIGLTLKINLDVNNVTINDTSGDGSLVLNIDFKIRNTNFDTLPEGKNAKQFDLVSFDGENISSTSDLSESETSIDLGDLGGGRGLLPGVNGFQMTSLVVSVIILTIIRKKKSN